VKNSENNNSDMTKTTFSRGTCIVKFNNII
jgi:hypothetical protein